MTGSALCWLLGHRWCFSLVRGDDGEPGGDICQRRGCSAERPNYTYPCRCLGRGYYDQTVLWCKCEFEGFACGLEYDGDLDVQRNMVGRA